MDPKLVVDNSSSNLTDALGISDDRQKQLVEKVATAVKEESTQSQIIARLWNEAETPAEAAYCLFIIEAAEEHAAISGLFAAVPMEG